MVFLNSSKFQELMHEKKTGAHLVGSFTVEIGDQDEASKYRYRLSIDIPST